jgi:pSer/pThr/pTyr-binding forkhead associated (FHA) protein
LAHDVWDEFSIFVLAKGTRYRVPVRTAVVSIGRSRRADICLPDRFVSRMHAVLHFKRGTVTVEDLGSSNGTRVREVVIGPRRPTRLGRREPIVVGISVLLVERRFSPAA